MFMNLVKIVVVVGLMIWLFLGGVQHSCILQTRARYNETEYAGDVIEQEEATLWSIIVMPFNTLADLTLSYFTERVEHKRITPGNWKSVMEGQWILAFADNSTTDGQVFLEGWTAVVDDLVKHVPKGLDFGVVVAPLGSELHMRFNVKQEQTILHVLHGNVYVYTKRRSGTDLKKYLMYSGYKKEQPCRPDTDKTRFVMSLKMLAKNPQRYVAWGIYLLLIIFCLWQYLFGDLGLMEWCLDKEKDLLKMLIRVLNLVACSISLGIWFGYYLHDVTTWVIETVTQRLTKVTQHLACFRKRRQESEGDADEQFFLAPETLLEDQYYLAPGTVLVEQYYLAPETWWLANSTSRRNGRGMVR